MAEYEKIYPRVVKYFLNPDIALGKEVTLVGGAKDYEVPLLPV
jgi:hypothetical protein